MTMTYEEARRLQAEAAAVIAATEAQARKEAMDEIVRLVLLHNIRGEELNRAISIARPRGAAKGKGKSGSAPAGAKYRNPENPSQTWTGRGRTPNWIKDVPEDQRGAYLVLPGESATATPATNVAPLSEAQAVKQTTQEAVAASVEADAASEVSEQPQVFNDNGPVEDDGYGVDPVEDALPPSTLFPAEETEEA